MVFQKGAAGLVGLVFIALVSMAHGANQFGTIPQTTGISFTDSKGGNWNLDSLLNAGCVVVSHQSWAG